MLKNIAVVDFFSVLVVKNHDNDGNIIVSGGSTKNRLKMTVSVVATSQMAIVRKGPASTHGMRQSFSALQKLNRKCSITS